MPNKLRHDYKPQTGSSGSKHRTAAVPVNFSESIKLIWGNLSGPALALLCGAILTIVAVFTWPSSDTDTDSLEPETSALRLAAVDSRNGTNQLTVNLELPELSETDSSLESIQPLDLNEPDSLIITVNSGDTLGELFTKNSLSYSDMLTILKDPLAKEHLTRIKPEDQLIVKTLSPEGQIKSLRYEIDIENALLIKRGSNDKFITTQEATPLERRVAYAHGTIKDSLFLAGMEAGLGDSLIMNMAGIFQWDIDFVQDIRKNDSFTVIYEQLWKNGEHVGNSAILAAEFNNKGDLFHAIRFVDDNKESNYYAPDGKSMKKAFLRAPIAFSPRVTSNFNPKRFHPVHKKVRPHRGVDYGGPYGTPILAAGDGKVIFRGRKGGYGNTVILQHGGNITTLYAHLSKFNKKARSGSRVRQGQTIGYLGASGTVTAKHLHYEYRLNGAHRNPRTVKLPNAKALPKQYKESFEKVKQPLLAQIDVIKRANNVLAQKNTGASSSAVASAAN